MALFPTTVIGSLPRPQWLKDLFDDLHEHKVDESRARVWIDQAVPYALALQEAAGVDIVSDGEWRRYSYVGVVCDLASGFARELSGAGRDGKYWHTVVGPVTPSHPGLLAEDARRAMSSTRRPLKVALPSPYLLSLRMWDKERSSKVYSTREEFAHSLVPILRSEVLALRDAGVHTIQLDDPHLCLLADPDVRATFSDPEQEAMHCVSLINEVFAGVTGVRKAVHLCRRNKGRKGWVGKGAYDAILEPLKALAVDQLMMEFAIPVAGDTHVLRELPSSMTIGLGCVDVRSESIDPVETIVTRVERALEHVEPSRLVLAPDCGFAPGNAADIPVDEAYAKLRNMARAAEVLRARHPGT